MPGRKSHFTAEITEVQRGARTRAVPQLANNRTGTPTQARIQRAPSFQLQRGLCVPFLSPFLPFTPKVSGLWSQVTFKHSLGRRLGELLSGSLSTRCSTTNSPSPSSAPLHAPLEL